MKVSVLGGGAWGTALAHMLAGNRDQVLLWARSDATVAEVNATRSNAAYLPDIVLSERILATTDLRQACRADVILSVTPAQSFTKILQEIAPFRSGDTKLVLCSKGLDRDSGKLLHELAAGCVEKSSIYALSGPSFAIDVARGLPTAVALGAAGIDQAKALAEELAAPGFRIYATADLLGVETGGALKNVLALAVGIARGLQLGASAEAALIARGFAELSRIGVRLGARPETMVGLSGLGDLVLTCSSPQSRNFSYGMALARGGDLSGLPLAEGVHTAASALRLAREHDVEAPIIEAVSAVIGGTVTAPEAVQSLLARPLREEAPS